MQNDFEKYMSILFNDGEYVNQVTNKYFDLDSTPYWTPEKLWVTCNPFKEGEKRKSPVLERLAEYRNFVIEFDQGTIEEQEELIKRLRIPYATVVFSGNKSLHVVIALELGITLEKYREFAHRIKMAVPCDPSCLEPARLTRVPYKDRQPLKHIGMRITDTELDIWLNSHGATSDIVKEKKRVKIKRSQMFGAQLTYKSLKFLAGQVPKSEAHEASLHTIKNLFEIGMDEDQIIEVLTDCRQRALPNEEEERSRRSVKRLVEWVENFWMTGEE